MPMTNNKANALFALVDCNNFYVSCERVFQPKLEKKPVIVLSSNDGCVVARSNESKALGIKMGVPYFQIRDIVRKNQVAVLSSNFNLYGDMSDRVMQILNNSMPKVEIYSIDEAFLDLSGWQQKALPICRYLAKKILRWTGLPVSIGIGPTRTLSKVANFVAKRSQLYPSVIDLSDVMLRKHILAKIAVGDIWGIGYKTAHKLEQMGICNALQLSQTDSNSIRKRFNIGVMRTVLELQAKPMIEIIDEDAIQKQILVSRSFGQKVSDLPTLQAALASHVNSAAQKLRQQGLVTQALLVFVQTQYRNRFERNSNDNVNTDEEPQSITLPLHAPTEDTRELISSALKGLNEIYRNTVQYRKIGVILLDLMEKHKIQLDLFQQGQHSNSDHLMKMVDEINQQMGRGTLHYAVQDLKREWQPKSTLRTPAYTTCWDELPRVLAK